MPKGFSSSASSSWTHPESHPLASGTLPQAASVNDVCHACYETPRGRSREMDTRGFAVALAEPRIVQPAVCEMRFSPATPPLPQSVREAGRSLAPLSAPGGVASLALRGTRKARIGQFDLSPKARPLTIRVEQDRNSIVLRAGGELDIASRAFGHRVPGATGLLEEFLNPTTFLRGTFAALEVGLTDNPASLFEESLRLIRFFTYLVMVPTTNPGLPGSRLSRPLASRPSPPSSTSIPSAPCRSRGPWSLPTPRRPRT